LLDDWLGTNHLGPPSLYRANRSSLVAASRYYIALDESPMAMFSSLLHAS
jgi:hypothetical protein